MVSFAGHSCVRLGDDTGSVIVTTSVGPRVIGLFGRRDNIFAEIPDEGLDCPGAGRFRFVGGHRLWAAPELPEITYQPDGRACVVTAVRGGARVEAPPDGAGLIKAIEVRRSADGWIVDHTIRNAAEAGSTVGPWAITQLRLGGEVHLPLGSGGAGHQADRSLVLWPYTNLDDPRLQFERNAVRIRAELGPPLKLGAAPSDARVAYSTAHEIFEKRIMLDPSSAYPDRGAAVQVYLCDSFCELETLGAMRLLGPGQQVEHRETWTLVERGADDR